MKKRFLRVVAIVLVISTFTALFSFGNFTVRADRKDELQSSIGQLEAESQRLEAQIKKLQGQIDEQEKLKAVVQEKIAVVQAQIDICVKEITKINDAIAANKATIDRKTAEIEEDKLKFKKRLRAIYMSNANNNLQILLGADDFSDFLYLSQLTSSVAARDKVLIERIVEDIKLIEEKQKENDALLQEQLGVKKIVDEKRAELQKENDAIQAIINNIDANQSKLESDNKKIEDDIKAKRDELSRLQYSGGTSFDYDGSQFLWPVPGHYYISSYYGERWGSYHYGIDIAGGGIAGKPIVAVADGVVTYVYNSCTHNYGKNGSCYSGGVRCGGGYGNYVVINHGSGYVMNYSHMSSAAVWNGQYVTRGQVIGYVGTTGWSTGYHLHFGISLNGGWRNPMNYY